MDVWVWTVLIVGVVGCIALCALVGAGLVEEVWLYLKPIGRLLRRLKRS